MNHTLNTQQAALLKLNLLNLMENPLPGNFDLKHLTALQQELWRHLPQDAAQGSALRPAAAAAGPIRRQEKIVHEGRSIDLIFVHSAMDALDHERLQQRLAQLEVEKCRQMKSSEFARLLCESWTELYYLRPFRDGNEAVLALFLKLFAMECGFSTPFDYLYINQSPLILPAFKAATAVSCGRTAMQLCPADSWLGLLKMQQQHLSEIYSLEKIFAQAVVPFRAFAFNHLVHDASARACGSLEVFFQQLQKLSPPVLQCYPELGPMLSSFVNTVRLTIRSGSSLQAQEETLNQLAEKCQQELAAGFCQPLSLLTGGRKFGSRLK